MSIPEFYKVECPFCGQHIEVPDTLAGEWITCPNETCGKRFQSTTSPCRKTTDELLQDMKSKVFVPSFDQIPPQKITTPARSKIPTVIWVGAGIFVLCAFFFAMIFIRGKQAPRALNDCALEMALNIVSNSLKAPSTAKFSATTCIERQNHTFLVSGLVDSQNSYGAMLRKDFNCVITNNGAGKLIWLGLTVGGDAQINPDFAPKILQLLSSQIVVFRDETSLQPEQHQYKTVKGVVKNISTHPLKSIFITYYLYDGEGNLAGSAKATHVGVGDALKPGELWDFTTEAFDYQLTPKLDTMKSYQ